MNKIKSIALMFCLIAFPISAVNNTTQSNWIKRNPILVTLGALALVKGGMIYTNAQPTPAEICSALNNGGALPLSSSIYLNVAGRDCSQYAQHNEPKITSPESPFDDYFNI